MLAGAQAGWLEKGDAAALIDQLESLLQTLQGPLLEA